jgi:hypothetical protein
VLAQPQTWVEADSIASILEYKGEIGYLATILSPEENAFILDSVLGGADPTPDDDQFYIGGRFFGICWGWQTAEVPLFWNWAPHEPNNIFTETVVSMWGHNTTGVNHTPGRWNNTLFTDARTNLARSWAVIEWGRYTTRIPDCGNGVHECGEACDGEPWCDDQCEVDCHRLLLGDTYHDGRITAQDIIFLVNHIFKGGSPPELCYALADASADGDVTVMDLIILIQYVFHGWDAPPDACTVIGSLWSCP